MQRTVPFESVSKVEMEMDDGSRRGVMAHTDCAVRKGLVQLSVPTPADPVRDSYDIEAARCAVCKRKLWKETEDGERVQHAQGRGVQGEGEEEEDDDRREAGAPLQGPTLHGLERSDMGAYRVKATQVDAEQIVGRNVNVSTRRGLITARDGDWVIHDSLGVAEVLDGDAFSKRYEAVPEDEVAPSVERHEPDPSTPKDAPREDVQFPAHMQDYLTGRSEEMPGEAGAPGDKDLTDAEAREAAKEPDEKPVVGSAAPIGRDNPPAPKNKGGRPKGSHGH